MNPKPTRLKRIPGSREIRLETADLLFLKDLSRVNLLSSDHATKYHYAHLKGGAIPPLGRLEAGGLIQSKTLRIPGRPPMKIYQFSGHAMARAWGGSLPIIGAKRNELHELISSDLYFKTGRPSDFRLAVNFTARDILAVGGCRPDALYSDSSTGELVVVEADSGQYSRQQIIKKIAAWESVGIKRIVWGQPQYAAARIPGLRNCSVYRF